MDAFGHWANVYDPTISDDTVLNDSYTVPNPRCAKIQSLKNPFWTTCLTRMQRQWNVVAS